MDERHQYLKAQAQSSTGQTIVSATAVYKIEMKNVQDLSEIVNISFENT